MRVYIAGPLETGATCVEDIQTNALKAAEIGIALAGLGFSPQCQHLWGLAWELNRGVGYARWIEIGLDLLSVCDVVLRTPGHSIGADIEVQRAIVLGIPVVYSLDELAEKYGVIKCNNFNSSMEEVTG